MALPPLIILHGEDNFALAERLTELKGQMGDPSMASLNTTELEGKSLTFSELRGLCDSLPFLTEQRLVIVRGLLTRLTGKSDGEEAESGSTADFVDGLLDYFGALPESTCLVLAETKSINEKSRLLKAAGQVAGAQLVKIDVPKGADLTKWIMKRAKAGDGEFSPAAAEALAMAAGDEPRLLAGEIDKLLAYVNWERPVEPADVEKLTPAAGEAVIWDLVDALGARNAQLALNRFHTLLAMPSQDQFAIFNMIVRQFRFLLQTKEIVEKGGTVNAVMQTLEIKSSFPADKYMKQSRNFSLKQLEAIYHQLLDLDLALKSGAGEDTTAIDTFIAGLTSK